MPENRALGKYDFSPIGAAIKRARLNRDISRETLSEICELSVGYIKEIENTGKSPGFQSFWRLVTMLNISVDEYFYPDNMPELDSRRRNIIGMINEVKSDDVYVLENVIKILAQRADADDEDEGESEE
jgi:transcriptional regulator with XRE-family HTH domain